MIEIGIGRLKLIDGRIIELPRQGIVAIVGPNNAGKSQFLREINETLFEGLWRPPVDHEPFPKPLRMWIEDSYIHKAGDIAAYFEENARVTSNNPAGTPSKGLRLPSSAAPYDYGLDQV